MKRPHNQRHLNLLRPMLAAAWHGAESRTPSQRADIYDGIAAVTLKLDHRMSRQAARLAAALRNAEGLQLHLADLFKDQG